MSVESGAGGWQMASVNVSCLDVSWPLQVTLHATLGAGPPASSPHLPFPTIVRPLGRVRGPHRRGWPGALTPRSVTQSFGGAASRGPNPFDTCVRRPPEVSGGAARLVPSRRSSNPTALSRGICCCRGTCTLMVSGGSVGNENLQVQRLQLSSTFCGTHAQCVRVANRERTERPAALGAVRRRGI